MPKDIVRAGDPILRARAAEVEISDIQSREIQQLVAELRATIAATQGVGLAAPQIGVPLRVILVQDREDYFDWLPKELLQQQERGTIDQYVLINPIITPLGEETRTYLEGCLSVAGYRAPRTTAQRGGTYLPRRDRPTSSCRAHRLARAHSSA